MQWLRFHVKLCRPEKCTGLLLTSCCFFFSDLSERAILRNTTLFILTISKLVTKKAHLVFFGNLSVQFKFSAFYIAFNMSTGMCMCLNSFMTPFARFIIFLQVSSFIISQKIKLRPCAAHL